MRLAAVFLSLVLATPVSAQALVALKVVDATITQGAALSPYGVNVTIENPGTKAVQIAMVQCSVVAGDRTLNAEGVAMGVLPKGRGVGRADLNMQGIDAAILDGVTDIVCSASGFAQ